MSEGTAKPEGTPAEGTPAEGTPAEGTPAEGTPAEGTPAEGYAFEAPEGVTLDKGQVDAFTAIAKELKLPKAAAQRIADLAIQREQARADEFQAQVQKWADEVTGDKELGGSENLAAAAAAVERFGTPEFKALLNSSGLGNHPEMVRFALKVGRAISEDKILGSGSGNKPKKSAAELLYGTPVQS